VHKPIASEVTERASSGALRTPQVAAGMSIGPWRLVAELGRGGMGTVWQAERADGQFDLKVALKLIRKGLDTEDVIERFVRERQILARLNHPGIARIIDGGIAPNDQPYLAMELVEGEPLMNWVRFRNPPLTTRLKLLLELCRAVSHAHGQLVLHRDLKPANVLVSRNNVAKLVDFGIAKVLLNTSSEHTQPTRLEERFFTRTYAAPETLRGDPTTVRTDVYGMGLVMWELLLVERMDSAARLNPHRALERPSRWLSKRDPLPAEAVPARQMSGDLDAILLQAMAFEPAHRYENIDALAEDIERYLAGQPIRARLDTSFYIVRKFLRRNWQLLSAALAIVLTLLGAVGFSYQEAKQARLAERRALEAKAFLVSMISASDPRLAGQNDLTVASLLANSIDRVERELGRQPATAAELSEGMAIALFHHGRYLDSLRAASQAARLYARVGNSEKIALMDLHQCYALIELSRFAEAVELWKSLRRRQAAKPLENQEVNVSLASLSARLHAHQGDMRAALAANQAAVAEARNVLPANNELLSSALNSYGLRLWQEGELKQAEAPLREALELRVNEYSRNEANLASPRHNLGAVLLDAGNFSEAERLLDLALTSKLSIYGAEHRSTFSTELMLAQLKLVDGRMESGLAELRRLGAIDR
jgi:eukaryotic-like serine/threonine-protein kinase